MATPRRQRLCIFVIAYHAEATLKQVLERIPKSIFETYECEVLVVDDASKDRTFEIGREYQAAHPEMPLVVLRNEFNQGYGGNQKVGYAYAVAEKFDFVAMVHGDGQYAPEELPRLLEPLANDEADAVFGSRMMTTFGALKGGMPLYKYVGNKILTFAQNKLLGTKLSEFHSGYRIYRCSTLERMPYRLNSNDFHFDTEIIIQLFNAEARVLELPIPTFYGDEISRVNGMKYAKDVMLATSKNALHRAGLMYTRRFDVTPREDESHYTLKLGYPSSDEYALDTVPAGAKVVDLGAPPTGLAQELAAKGCEVAVVDDEAPKTPVSGVDVVVHDLNDAESIDVSKYDYLLLLDVLEHLRDPEEFIESLRKQFDHRKRVLVLSTPNVGFFVQRVMLTLGQFNYGRAGILDRTHTRLFTFRSLHQLLDDAGFRIKELKGVPAPFPKVFGNGLLGKTATNVNLALIKLSKTLFSYQIFVVAESTPDVQFLLANAKRSGGLKPGGERSAKRGAAARDARVKSTKAARPRKA